MDDLSYNDIHQQYQNNLVAYKGQIVFVSRVYEDKRVKLVDLETRLDTIVPFELQHFSVIKSRLGMVNVADAVVYMSRVPVRKMGIGINRGNILVESLPIEYPQGARETVSVVSQLVDRGVLYTLQGKYPSIQEAYDKAIQNKPCTVAFDRQFAVSYDGTVYYKTKAVGMFTKKGETVLYKGYEHLTTLLEGNHEKTIGYSCS